MLAEALPTTNVIETSEGQLEIWHASPLIVVTRAEGRLGMIHGTPLMEMLEAALTAHSGEVQAFHDWTGIQSYEMEVQVRMTTWSLTHISKFRRVVIAADSPMVALALRTANIAMGNRFEVLRTREELEEVMGVVLG
jgi:hypothetical protein